MLSASSNYFLLKRKFKKLTLPKQSQQSLAKIPAYIFLILNLKITFKPYTSNTQVEYFRFKYFTQFVLICDGQNYDS